MRVVVNQKQIAEILWHLIDKPTVNARRKTNKPNVYTFPDWKRRSVDKFRRRQQMVASLPPSCS